MKEPGVTGLVAPRGCSAEVRIRPHTGQSQHELACHRSRRDGAALYAVSIKLALTLYTMLVPHVSTGRLHFLSGLYVLE